MKRGFDQKLTILTALMLVAVAAGGVLAGASTLTELYVNARVDEEVGGGGFSWEDQEVWIKADEWSHHGPFSSTIKVPDYRGCMTVYACFEWLWVLDYNNHETVYDVGSRMGLAGVQWDGYRLLLQAKPNSQWDKEDIYFIDWRDGKVIQLTSDVNAQTCPLWSKNGNPQFLSENQIFRVHYWTLYEVRLDSLDTWRWRGVVLDYPKDCPEYPQVWEWDFMDK